MPHSSRFSRCLLFTLRSGCRSNCFLKSESTIPSGRCWSKSTPDGENPVTGTLRFIDNSVDSTTDTIKLKAEFPNSDRALWPGQFVNVKAQLEVEHGRIVVPSRTIQTGPQGKYVWVVNPANKTVAMRPVQVLRNYHPPKTAEEAIIGSGLQPGEMVISEGQMRLAPGMKVELLKTQAQMGDAQETSVPGQS